MSYGDHMVMVPNSPAVSIEQALGVAEVARILGVPPWTMERRRAGAASLFVRRRAVKLCKIWNDLTALFTPENAIAWLKNPVPVLENRAPVDVMSEDGGLDRVLDVIGRMACGIPK